MTSATLNLSVVSKRMLTESEAAHYCGRSVKRFKVECPVKPAAFANGDRRWDIRNLDAWLDMLSEGMGEDADAIVARLG